MIERTRFLSTVFLCSEFLFTDTAAILNKFNLRSIIGCPGGGEVFMSTFRLYFRALFETFFLKVFLELGCKGKIVRGHV